jgi:hypothetical protein
MCWAARLAETQIPEIISSAVNHSSCARKSPITLSAKELGLAFQLPHGERNDVKHNRTCFAICLDYSGIAGHFIWLWPKKLSHNSRNGGSSV